MTARQRHRFDLLERKGYQFDMHPVPHGRGAMLLTSVGHWIDYVELVLNVDGSYHQAYIESDLAYLGASV